MTTSGAAGRKLPAGPAPVLTVALLGAESTGKTALAEALVHHFEATGRPALRVAEVLRDWCAHEGRTPRRDEQRSIAQAQQHRIDAAVAAVADQPGGAVVVADTTPLMTAVYSDLLFQDLSLYPFALQHLQRCDVVLLMGLDLPWVADGIQRDGPHVREPVDSRLRGALAGAGIAFRVVYGQRDARLVQALNAIDSIATSARSTCAKATFSHETGAGENWTCGNCGDAECEFRLFSRLRGG